MKEKKTFYAVQCHWIMRIHEHIHVYANRHVHTHIIFSQTHCVAKDEQNI